MKWILILNLLFTQLCFQMSFASDFSTEHTIQQLQNNRQIDLSLYPTVHTYRAVCNVDDSIPLAQLPIVSQMCQTIMQSELCSEVEIRDRLDCRQAGQTPQFNLWDFLSGCSSGIMESISELMSFLWDIMKWVWNNATSSEARSQTSAATSRFSHAIRAYLHTEYQRAYARTSFPFREAKAMTAMGESISRMIIGLVSDLVTQQYRQFGCLNFRAKSKLMCRLIGDIFVPPAAMLALIMRGPAVIRQFPSLSHAFNRLKASSAEVTSVPSSPTLREAERLGEESAITDRVTGNSPESPPPVDVTVQLSLRNTDGPSVRQPATTVETRIDRNPISQSTQNLGRRHNFEQRQMIDHLQDELGDKVDLYQNLYARGREFTESDRHFFAGILEESSQRLLRENPNMTEGEIQSRLQRTADDLMEKCRER